MSTQPTDAEIDELWRFEASKNWDSTLAMRTSYTRAALARWGQPAHSGEPVGYLYCGGSYGDELADWEIVAEQLQCDRLNEHHGALGKEAKLPLYTEPKPVEREPLPSVEIMRIVLEVEQQHNFLRGTTNWAAAVGRAIESAHGITKGGQHG